jgi:hypothetical protein
MLEAVRLPLGEVSCSLARIVASDSSSVAADEAVPVGAADEAEDAVEGEREGERAERWYSATMLWMVRGTRRRSTRVGTGMMVQADQPREIGRIKVR